MSLVSQSSARKFCGKFPVGHVAKKGEKRGSGWNKVLLLVRGIPQYSINSIYQVGRYFYWTDPLYSRVCYAYGCLFINKVDRYTSQQTAVGKLVILQAMLAVIYLRVGLRVRVMP